MKAAIVETHRSYAVALLEDGRFTRLRGGQYEVGQTLSVRKKAPNPRGKITAYASLAAVLLLFVLGGYRMPYGLVSLDVNPSIEYTTNFFDRVIHVSAVNDDGQTILSQLSQHELLNMNIGDAIDRTIVQLQNSGYLSDASDDYVMLASNSVSQKHAEKLAVTLQNRVNTHAHLSVESVTVSKGDVEQAHSMGTSAGKLVLIDRLKASSADPSSFDESEWLDAAVRDIVHATQNHGSTGTNGKNSEDSCGLDGEDCPDNPGLPPDNASSGNQDNPSNENKSDNAAKDHSNNGSGGNSGNSSGNPHKAMVTNYLEWKRS
jgi:hypothetical protein